MAATVLQDDVFVRTADPNTADPEPHMRMKPRLDARAERGFSMFITIMAMAVTAMFVAASFAAVNGDLPVSGASKDRKATYAAAEAGLDFYLNHLQENPDYWTLCNKAPDPNTSEKSPINLQWDGAGKDPRMWRTVPDSTSQYTIELLDTKDYPERLRDHRSEVDRRPVHGHVQDPLHRPARTRARPLRRSIEATFRRDSFLSFVYFTDYETSDPAASASLDDRGPRSRPSAPTRCARSASAAGCPSSNEISFHDGDAINGPEHTNDESVFVCGTVTFGRNKTISGSTMNPQSDTVEVRGAAARPRGQPRHVRLHRRREDLHPDHASSRPTRSTWASRSPTRRSPTWPRTTATTYYGQHDHPPQRRHDGRDQLRQQRRDQRRPASRSRPTA